MQHISPHKTFIFRARASQPCEDLFIDLEFEKKIIYWNQMNSSLGPKTVSTDYGTCCSINPQIRSALTYHMEDIFWHDCTFGKQVWDRLQNETEYVQIA